MLQCLHDKRVSLLRGQGQGSRQAKVKGKEHRTAGELVKRTSQTSGARIKCREQLLVIFSPELIRSNESIKTAESAVSSAVSKHHAERGFFLVASVTKL